jgi:hypothetical protein
MSKDRILDKTISIQLHNTTIKTILKAIEDIGKVKFSYNPDIIDDRKIVSITLKQQTIRYGLNTIFEQKVQLKEVGAHILILEKPAQKDLKADEGTVQRTHCIISGIVYDNDNKKGIAYASVYDVDSKYSVLTDKNGRFALRVPTSFKTISLYYAKSQYRTNIKLITPTSINDTLNGSLGLYRQIDSISKLQAPQVPHKIWIDIEDKTISGELFSIPVSAHNENLRYLNENRWAQVSLVPQLTLKAGKNYRGILYNHLSINILGGYSKGLKGLELGGIANVLKDKGYGFQVAGIINLVGSNFSGLQIGGISNIVRGNYYGIQIGGISNTVRQNYYGLQLAGVVNHINGAFNGIQLAIVGNKVESQFTGIQLGGLINFTEKQMNGIQVAGFSNLSKTGFNGLQVAGLINHTTESSFGLQFSVIQNVALHQFIGAQITGIMNSAVEGTNLFQAAGITNIAKKNNGLQVAGLVNYAKQNNGLQIGLVNISKINKGLSLGLVNFVWDGYHKIELLANETAFANIRVKSGVKRFYNIYSLGYQFDGIKSLTAAGFGYGAIYNISQQLAISTDIEGMVLFDNSKAFTQLAKFSPSFDFKVSDHFAIFAGPTFNVNFSYTENDFNTIKLEAYSLYSETTDDYFLNYWIGGQFGIRL